MGKRSKRVQPDPEGTSERLSWAPVRDWPAIRFRMILCCLSGVMLGFSFPPFPLGVLACLGLVPLLIVLEDLTSVPQALRYSYLAMLVFHAITLNWTGGYSHMNDVYMMIAGGVTMLVHPVFYWIPVAAYMYVRRHLGLIPALIALPALWVGYEYTHTLSEWSFPWLTLGNSQTYDLARIQFISFTGVFGLSFWIVCLNVLGYLLYLSIVAGRTRLSARRNVILAASFLGLYFIPMVYGMVVLDRHPAEQDMTSEKSTITVGIVQPNLDPWDKWKMTGYETVDLYLRLTERLLDSIVTKKPDIVLWPETAIPMYLIARHGNPLLDEFKGRISRLGVPVLSGVPQAVFYKDSTLAPRSAKRVPETGERYDAFNAAAFFTPGSDSIPWYGKMKMVPIAERVPYADFFAFMDFLRWGVGIGGWQIGPDSTIFHDVRTGARFSTMICYESVYPSFVAAFVRKGAEFITIITIDSWWGKMSGAYQHAQFAILRAVENRRWVARCALGGISCYIDPYGRVQDRSDLFTRALLCRTIGRETDLTHYTRYGDWFSEICLMISGLMLAASFGSSVMKKRISR